MDELRRATDRERQQYKMRIEELTAQRDEWKQRCQQAEAKLKAFDQEPSLASLHWEGGMYHGNVRNKMPHDEGTLRTLDGQNSLYEGQWADGKRHGKGKEYATCQVLDQQGGQMGTKMCLVYEGDWQVGKREGQGQAYYQYDGPVLWFDGEWREGLANSGMLFPDGTYYGGKHADGTPKGPITPIRWREGEGVPKIVPGVHLHQWLQCRGVSAYLPAAALG
mmetsp:Transcript_27686/g.79655  ORF Transcript_27686/g.79655 Transcript_27686/m.79655 type:complete len:221 (+) Transcript_27686:164-826(+)